MGLTIFPWGLYTYNFLPPSTKVKTAISPLSLSRVHAVTQQVYFLRQPDDRTQTASQLVALNVQMSRVSQLYQH
jgi:hypothetical protein